jgi:Phosphopantetheine attachment site
MSVYDDDLVQRVRLAWAEVLDLDAVDSIPLDTNFLDAGGNSLLLVMLWEQLQGMTSDVVKMSDLFHHGTVRAQAALLAPGGVTRDGLTAVGTRNRQQLLGRARRSGPAAGQDLATG